MLVTALAPDRKTDNLSVKWGNFLEKGTEMQIAQRRELTARIQIGVLGAAIFSTAIAASPAMASLRYWQGLAVTDNRIGYWNVASNWTTSGGLLTGDSVSIDDVLPAQNTHSAATHYLMQNWGLDAVKFNSTQMTQLKGIDLAGVEVAATLTASQIQFPAGLNQGLLGPLTISTQVGFSTPVGGNLIWQDDRSVVQTNGFTTLQNVQGHFGGDGALVKQGPGGLWLNSNLNTHRGGTQLNGGYIVLGYANALGDSDSLTERRLTMAGGTTLRVSFNSVDSQPATHIKNPITINGDVTLGWEDHTPIFDGNIDLNTPNQATSRALTVRGAVSINSVISGSGGITKKGVGILSLNGTNSFTGRLDITAGEIAAKSASAFGTGDSSLANGTVISDQATLSFPANTSIPDGLNWKERIDVSGAGVRLTGEDKDKRGVIDVGDNSTVYNRGRLTVTSGKAILRVGANSKLTLQGGATQTAGTVARKLRFAGTGTVDVNWAKSTRLLSIGVVTGSGATYIHHGAYPKTSPPSIITPIDPNDADLDPADIGIAGIFEFEDEPDFDVAGSNPTGLLSTVVAGDSGVFASEFITGSSANDFYFNTDTYDAVILGSVHGDGQMRKIGTGSLEAANFRTRSLNIQAGRVVVSPYTGNDSTSVVKSLTVASGATLDLANSDLVIDYTGTSPAAAIRSLITQGRANGTGVIASLADNNAAHKTALGYAEASSFGFTTFSGQPVDTTALLLKFTYNADADLSGAVDFTDLLIVAQNYSTTATGKEWSTGDFNYDGYCNYDDLLAEAQNHNSGALRRGGYEGAYEVFLELQAGAPWILEDVLSHPEGYELFSPYLNGDTAGRYMTQLQNYNLTNNLVPEPSSLAAIALLALPLSRRR